MDLYIIAQTFSDMTKPKLAFFSVVAGVALGGIIKGWYDHAIKHLEYAHAYHIKLTDKRMAVYQEFEELLSQFRNVFYFIGDTEQDFGIEVDFSAFSAFNSAVYKIKDKSLWLGPETSKAFADFENHLKEVREIYGRAKPGDGFIKLNIKNAQGFATGFLELRDGLYNDHLNLHKISKLKPVKWDDEKGLTHGFLLSSRSALRKLLGSMSKWFRKSE